MKQSDLRGVFVRCVIGLLALLLTSPAFAEVGDPPGRVARLSYAQGKVSLQPSGESQWSEASTNYTVTTGDRLYADQGSRAELEVGPFAVRISQTTDLTIANLNDQIMQLGLGQGSIRVTIYDLPSSNSVEIDTPNGALTLLRAGSYRVDTDPNRNSTLVTVSSGSLEVSGGGVSQVVQGGQAVQLTGTDSIQVNRVSIPNQDEFDQWCATRDRRVQSFASRQYVNPYTPGAEDLDAYGRWQVAAEYGPVWYPTGVSAGWVPYRDGHWAWVQPWGWTWVENEPWGFCPFHYGRWAFIGSRWGWVPGPVAVAPVYAPALVAFVGGGGLSIGVRTGGGVGLAAWFPLGPREPFSPWYRHGGNYLRQVNITNVRNVTNITNITNVNNIRYANRMATTAVPVDVFRGGRPVARQMIRVAPEQLGRAQVVAHPGVSPTPGAVYGGRAPVRTPPVRTARVMAPPAGARSSAGSPVYRPGGQPDTPPTYRNGPAGPGRNDGGQVQPPTINRTGPPAIRTAPNPPPNTPPVYRNGPAGPGRNDGGQVQPPTINRTGPPAIRAAPNAPPNTPPVYRNGPAAGPNSTGAGRVQRPPEPQQERNLRMGRQPGQMQDREAVPRAPVPPQGRGAPAVRQQDRQPDRRSRPESRGEEKR